MIKKNTNLGDNHKIKILFLAWGFSIHAQRRIQIFVDDPLFDITVVSTYNYQFSGVTTIPLIQARTNHCTGSAPGSWKGYLFRRYLMVINFYLFLPIYKIIHEIMILIRDYAILRRTIEQKQPDIIFLQTLLYPNYLVFLIGRSIPIIITFWNGDVTWWAKYTDIERLFKKQIVIRGIKRAAAITVNSRVAFDACLNYVKSANRIHLIRYPGVDLSRFHPIDKELAKKHIGEIAPKNVFWPRGTGDYLNFDTLVAASQIVLKKYTDLHFIILFANRHVDFSIMEDLKVKGIEKNYSLLEKISFEDMPHYYSAADMMISLSSNDSLPNTMLEAMACGCPVIMGDIPQIRDWITDGKNGYLCPVKDADKLAECIIKVLEDPQKMNATFIQENMNRIKQDLDSNKMNAQIKQLVVNISSEYRK